MALQAGEAIQGEGRTTEGLTEALKAADLSGGGVDTALAEVGVDTDLVEVGVDQDQPKNEAASGLSEVGVVTDLSEEVRDGVKIGRERLQVTGTTSRMNQTNLR